MKRFLAALFVFLVGCSAPACSTTNNYSAPATAADTQYQSNVARIIAESSMRVLVDCDSNDKPDGFGSGVAVSSRYFITAHHVAHMCDEELLSRPRFYTLDRFGTVKEMVIDKETTLGADATRMRLTDDESDYRTYAEIANYMPVVDQEISIYAGGLPVFGFLFKTGKVSGFKDGQFTFSMHAVPGNSGSGVFDSNGRVIGILWGGVWDPRMENLGIAYLTRRWLDLVP